MNCYKFGVAVTDLGESFDELSKTAGGATAAIRRLLTALENNRSPGSLRGYSQSHLRKLLKQWLRDRLTAPQE